MIFLWNNFEIYDWRNLWGCIESINQGMTWTSVAAVNVIICVWTLIPGTFTNPQRIQRKTDPESGFKPNILPINLFSALFFYPTDPLYLGGLGPHFWQHI